MVSLTRKQSLRLEAYLLKDAGLELVNEAELVVSVDGVREVKTFINLHLAEKAASQVVMRELTPGTQIVVS